MDNLSIFSLQEDFSIYFQPELLNVVEESSLDDREEEDETSRKVYDEADVDLRESYNVRFNQELNGFYTDDEGNIRDENSIKYDDLQPDAFENAEKTMLLADNIIIDPLEHSNVNYTDADINTYLEQMGIHDATAKYKDSVLTMDYGGGGSIGGQATYQRIVFEADADGESVYELTMRKLGEAGIEFSTVYDSGLGTMLFDSINGKGEDVEKDDAGYLHHSISSGDGGNFNEFYVDGAIGSDAVDKQLLDKGAVIEWRYAEETDGSCGGCPDFDTVRTLVEYGSALQGAPTMNSPPGFQVTPFQQDSFMYM